MRGQINNSNHHRYHHHQRDVLRWEVPQRKFCIFIVTKRTSGRIETECTWAKRSHTFSQTTKKLSLCKVSHTIVIPNKRVHPRLAFVLPLSMHTSRHMVHDVVNQIGWQESIHVRSTVTNHPGCQGIVGMKCTTVCRHMKTQVATPKIAKKFIHLLRLKKKENSQDFYECGPMYHYNDYGMLEQKMCIHDDCLKFH